MPSLTGTDILADTATKVTVDNCNSPNSGNANIVENSNGGGAGSRCVSCNAASGNLCGNGNLELNDERSFAQSFLMVRTN